MGYKNIKWKDNLKDYELQIRNVGMTKEYPIQIVLEVWDKKRTRRTFIDIPKGKTEEFLEAINEIDEVDKINKEKNK
jgi:hypothetical protein